MKHTHFSFWAAILVLLVVSTVICLVYVHKYQALTLVNAKLTGERDRLKADLESMTKRYCEESAENSAITTYLANIPRKMNFSEPFGLKLRTEINRERILPSGIYIREGQYEDFEISDTVVDMDTMSFAKLSGQRQEETEEKDLDSYMAALEKRIVADLAAANYPFKVSHRVWQEEGIVNFEIVDVEMFEKMSRRENKTRDQSLELMKAYRDK